MKRILFVLTICLFSQLFSDVIDTIPPIVVEFEVNGKSFFSGIPEVAPSVLAEFEISISDSGSGLESVRSFIDFDEDGNFSKKDSLICNYTNLNGFRNLISIDTIDLFYIIPNTYNIVVEVSDTSGNINSDKNFRFTIVEGGSPSVPIIAAIDENILGSGEIQITMFAFSNLLHPSGFRYWPGYVKYEYNNGEDWVEIDCVYSEECVQEAENNFTLWPFKFNFDEELKFFDKEVRACFMLTYYNSDTLKIAGPSIIPKQILENNIKPMSDGIIEIKSNNQVSSPYNVVLTMTKSDTVKQFDIISTEKINGLYRGTLPTDPCGILGEESGTMTFWTFCSMNINQPGYEFDLNASVLNIDKIYKDQNTVVSSYDSMMTVKVDSGQVSEDALVYFEPDFVAFYDCKPEMDGFHIHTNYSGEKAMVEFTMKHGQNMAVITNPVIEFYIRDLQNNNGFLFNSDNPNDTITLIDFTDSTVSFVAEFRNDLIYFVRVFDEDVLYHEPIANFELVNPKDSIGFMPHTVQFRNTSVPAHGRGSGECTIRWDFDGIHWFEYSAYDTAENVNWEDSYSGLITGTNGSPSFTYTEPDTYTVTLTITDTKGGGQDSYSKIIIIEPVDLYLESVEIAQFYTNHEGKTYTSSTPEIEIEVGYPEENEAALKAHVYLNGHHVLFQSVPQDGFNWNGFSDGSAIFQILNETDGSVNRFLKTDEVNEIYVVVYDENAGLEVTSEVIEFGIDATPPFVTIQDEDEDFILGPDWKNTDDAYFYFDIEDKETNISLGKCQYSIKDKESDDEFFYNGESFEQIEKSAKGYKLKYVVKFTDFWEMISNGTFANDLTLSTTITNNVGMETTVSYEFSFDFVPPEIRLADDEIWNQITQDSIEFDNDNDGKVNEDPIDGINNDGDWDDVNCNGRRDYYFNEWYEYVYDFNGQVLDSIGHKEAMLEPEFVDEDPVDYLYYNEDYSMDISYGFFLQILYHDPEISINYFDENEIWTATSGLDIKSFEFYRDYELLDATLNSNGAVIGGADPIGQGIRNIAIFISDHSGNQTGFYFKTKQYCISIEDIIEIQHKFTLSPAYPNPFNPTTTIKYSLAKDSHVLLSIYDSNGNLIENIVNEQKEVGYHQINWNASGLPSGVYFYKLVTSDFVDVKKCLLVK
ncbi:MAG: T9SS type A sorting domain-containing protein [Candidatus Marinimicrobia bacterium]|nr:T9SS type A sorting domain-containing protein [Candidatus Neomarinimicrobiota bacterium]